MALKFLLADGLGSNSRWRALFARPGGILPESSQHRDGPRGDPVESSFAIVMEHVEGASLRSLCGSAQPVDSVIRTGQQIANLSAEAHLHGIVHRDVKPENMVRGDGYVKVLDFGLRDRWLSRPGETGLPAGTLRYMSPEQIRGEALTGGTDVFSLGLTFYELLTGRHPFESPSSFQTAVKIAQEEPQAPSKWNGFVPSRSKPWYCACWRRIRGKAVRRGSGSGACRDPARS